MLILWIIVCTVYGVYASWLNLSPNMPEYWVGLIIVCAAYWVGRATEGRRK